MCGPHTDAHPTPSSPLTHFSLDLSHLIPHPHFLPPLFFPPFIPFSFPHTPSALMISSLLFLSLLSLLLHPITSTPFSITSVTGCSSISSHGCSADVSLTIRGGGFPDPTSGLPWTAQVMTSLGHQYPFALTHASINGTTWLFVGRLPSLPYYETLSPSPLGIRVQSRSSGAWSDIAYVLTYEPLSAPSDASAVAALFSMEGCRLDCHDGVLVTLTGVNLPYTEPVLLESLQHEYTCTPTLNSTASTLYCVLPPVYPMDLNNGLELYPTVEGTRVTSGANLQYSHSAIPATQVGVAESS